MLDANQRVFENRYQPLVSAFANGGLNAVVLSEIPRRFGASAGLSLSMYLFDGHQRQLSRDRTRALLETTRAYQRNFATVNPVRQQQHESAVIALPRPLPAPDTRFYLRSSRVGQQTRLLLK